MEKVVAEDPSKFGDTCTTGWPPRRATAVEWNQLEPRRQVVCDVGNRAREVTQALGKRFQTLGIGLFIAEVWFCFDLVVTAPLEVKKYLYLIL